MVGICLDFTIRCSIRWESDGLDVGVIGEMGDALIYLVKMDVKMDVRWKF